MLNIAETLNQIHTAKELIELVEEYLEIKINMNDNIKK